MISVMWSRRSHCYGHTGVCIGRCLFLFSLFRFPFRISDVFSNKSARDVCFAPCVLNRQLDDGIAMRWGENPHAERDVRRRILQREYFHTVVSRDSVPRLKSTSRQVFGLRRCKRGKNRKKTYVRSVYYNTTANKRRAQCFFSSRSLYSVARLSVEFRTRMPFIRYISKIRTIQRTLHVHQGVPKRSQKTTVSFTCRRTSARFTWCSKKKKKYFLPTKSFPFSRIVVNKFTSGSARK